jgi:hypothetical protein
MYIIGILFLLNAIHDFVLRSAEVPVSSPRASRALDVTLPAPGSFVAQRLQKFLCVVFWRGVHYHAARQRADFPRRLRRPLKSAKVQNNPHVAHVPAQTRSAAAITHLNMFLAGLWPCL